MQVQELLTDNGSPYRSAVHEIACRALGIRHLRTRPRRPQTNGKACVLGWRWTYNHRRPHQAIGRQTPITRMNNLLGSYS
jgi:transposase InsO family protein